MRSAAIVPRLKDALAAVERETFDLAILDVHLHGESAFPVAEALIAKGVPFVFATGYGERGLPENYRGRPVLQKPFAKDDLERVLKTLYSRSAGLSGYLAGCPGFLAAAGACLRRPIFSHGSRRSRASRFGRFSTVKAFDVFCDAELLPGQRHRHRRARPRPRRIGRDRGRLAAVAQIVDEDAVLARRPS